MSNPLSRWKLFPFVKEIPSGNEHPNSGNRKYSISEEWLRSVIKQYSLRQIEKLFGIPRNTLHLTMKDYGIESPRPPKISTPEHSKYVHSFKKRKKTSLGARVKK